MKNVATTKINLADGTYKGLWSSDNLRIHTGRSIVTIKTKTGVRGINIPCEVIITNGEVEAKTRS